MKTKTILSIWAVVFLGIMLGFICSGQLKISQYPNTNNLGPNQLFIVTAGGTNMNVKASDMPSALSVPTLAQMYGVGANLTGFVYSVGANTTNFAKSITNGDLYISGHLTVQSNLTVGGTNSTVELEAGTLTVSNDIAVTGGASFGAAVTSSANSASNGPAANEFPNASWVRGLFNNGQLLYAGPGQRTDATNVSSGQIMYLFTNNIPPTSSRKYATVNAGDYIGSVMTSNSLTFLQGPIYVHAYLQSSNGNGGQSVSVHPEIYYSYDRTNWQGDFSANDQVLSQSTNLYEWVVSFPAVTSTNATGFWVERRFKVGAASGATHPDVYFHLGTNYLTSSNDASHIAFSGPSSEMGNAFLANNQTFTGLNTFSASVTFQQSPIYPYAVSNVWDATNFLVDIKQTLYIQSSNLVGLTNFLNTETGNGTGIIYQNVIVAGVSNTPGEIRWPTNAQFGFKFRWMGTKPTHATNDASTWFSIAWRGTNATVAGATATGQ